MENMIVERLSTGVRGLDELIEGGIPRGFFVVVTGEPGCGKTVLCIHFINQGILENDKNIYITTEESRNSIINQAAQFNMDFSKAITEKKLIIIDALMGGEDPWTLKSLDLEALINKVIEAKKYLGYGRARVVIDSISAYWLDKPAMARRYSYFIKKVLSKWDFTVMATAQYAITTGEAHGFGVEHVGDIIIRFKRVIRGGKLCRFLIIEKARQTNHSLYAHEISIATGQGLVVGKKLEVRRENYILPRYIYDKIISVKKEKAKEFNHSSL